MIMKGVKQNGLYVSLGETITGRLYSATRDDSDRTKPWHQRMGHLSDRGLKELHKHGLLYGDQVSKVEFCEYCINGKVVKFKEWKSLVESQRSKKIKVLRTDNGLEFWNEDFNYLCSSSGLERHRTVRKTLQQNGLAKRMNRTLLDRVRYVCSFVQVCPNISGVKLCRQLVTW